VSEIKPKSDWVTKDKWIIRCMAAENTVRAQDIELNTQRQALAKAELDARWLQDEVDRLRKVARGWGIAWAVAVTCLAVIAAARLIGGAQ
jgi:hypothetical protein